MTQDLLVKKARALKEDGKVWSDYDTAERLEELLDVFNIAYHAIIVGSGTLIELDIPEE